MRDHDEESFADGTPLPPPEEPPAGPGKGPSQAQLLMAMAEDTYRLIRSADGRAYAVPKMGPQIAVPLASRSGNSIRARLAASLHRQTARSRAHPRWPTASPCWTARPANWTRGRCGCGLANMAAQS